MVHTRSRVLSFPGSQNSSQQDFGGFSRSKSLNSLHWCNSSPSTAESASTFSITAAGGDAIPAIGNQDANQRRRLSSSSSTDAANNSSDPVESSPERKLCTQDSIDDQNFEIEPHPAEVEIMENPGSTDCSTPLNTPDHQVLFECNDDVFTEEPREEEIPVNGENTQLSVIDEEKDDHDAESAAPLETLDEESDANMSKLSLEAVGVSLKDEEEEDEEDELGARSFLHGRQRPSIPTLGYHGRCQSMSSFDIPHSFSQPETIGNAGGDSNDRESASAATTPATPASKLPIRRINSNRDAVENGNRPFSQNYDALDEGTILVTLSSSSSSVASKALDRSLSASTPSIDSVVNELARGTGQRDANTRKSKHSRTPSLVVPTITPRIPLIGILPQKSKTAERSGDVTKTRSSGIFGRKRSKLNESRPHFWIKNSCSNSDCCDICSKPLANTDAYQCNDCFASVHASCKSSVDKTACIKMKHPKPGKTMPAGPLRPPIPDSPAARGDSKSGNGGDHQLLHSESVRVQPTQRHSVVGIFPDASSLAYSLTAPAGLAQIPPSCRTYSNGFRSYLDMDEPWKALDLWDEIPEAWSTGPGKSEKKKLTTKEVKRQDNFHELFITEQHHCQTLTVLKYTYVLGLLTNRIMSYDRITQLLPCLDELIDIHYRFFESLKKKRDESIVVGSIHDVLLEQFSNDIGEKMIKAYTHFCFQKDATVREYNRLMSGSAEFSNFIKNAIAGVFYKSRSLPDCLLLVTQRLSKYHSFVENLRKNTADDSSDKEGILRAEKAVKELVSAVDSGIERSQMQQTRMEICNLMDPRSSTELTLPGDSENGTAERREFFKVDDLRSPERTLLYHGDVFWQNARQKAAEVTLLLFSDVIVFLQKNGSGSYNFFRQDGKSGVVRLQKLIVRDKAAGRLGSQGIYLIATSPKPEMYDISCKSKKGLGIWMDRIQRAVQVCSARGAGDVKQVHSLLTGKEEEELQQFFDKLAETNYYTRCVHDAKMKAYDEMFSYIAKLPIRSNEDKEKIVSILKGFKDDVGNAGYLENFPMVWQAMQERFGNSTSATTVPTIEEPENYPEEKESTGVDLGRSKTFHFAAQQSAGKKPKLRKHPTVSGIPEMDGHSGKRPSLINVMGDISVFDGEATTEATMYLLNCWSESSMQMDELRQENLRLTAELALAKERSRQTAGALACDSSLEDLRRLSTELEARRKQFHQEKSDKEIEWKCKEAALKQKEESLAKEDAEIQERWSRLKTSWENQQLHGLRLPPLVMSPSSNSNYNSDGVQSPIVLQYSGPAIGNHVLDSPPIAPPQHHHMQRATSFRPVDVPPHLRGSLANDNTIRGEPTVRQQLPTILSKDSGSESFLSKKFRASSKDKGGGKKYGFIGTSKSPDRQMIPNKLAINKK